MDTGWWTSDHPLFFQVAKTERLRAQLSEAYEMSAQVGGLRDPFFDVEKYSKKQPGG